jgi:RNA polymerase sigma-B factor
VEILLRAPESTHRIGGRKTRNELIEATLPLVHALARRYAGRGEHYDDLVQIGTIGLIKAVDRFDPERRVALETYASVMIVGEIKRHFRDRGWAVRVPRRLKELDYRLKVLTDQMTASSGHPPTIAELAKAAGTGTEEALEAIQAGRAHTVLSFSLPATGDPDNVLGDTIADPKTVFADIDDRVVISSRIARLNEKECEVFALRFYADLTQSEIAQRIGVSQMHVSRLLKRSLEKISAAA